MALNQVFPPSRTRSLPVPDGTKSGDPRIVGSLPVMVLVDEGKGGNSDNFASCALDGAWRLPIATTTAGAVGSPVYLTSGNVVTPAASGNTLYGYLLEAKGTTANQECAVELAQV